MTTMKLSDLKEPIWWATIAITGAILFLIITSPLIGSK